MSKLETPMTQRYWKKIGGTLIEEYLAVPGGPGVGYRKLDAVIILGGEPDLPSNKNISLDGKDIIIVQTKASRLGTHLLGQAYYSRKLILRRFSPKSVRTVALCGGDDAILREFAKEDEIEIVIDDEACKCSVPVFPTETHGSTIIVKTNQRLGMYVMGQARYSRKLLERSLVSQSVRTIIRCATDDAVLGPLARADGIEVQVKRR